LIFKLLFLRFLRELARYTMRVLLRLNPDLAELEDGQHFIAYERTLASRREAINWLRDVRHFSEIRPDFYRHGLLLIDNMMMSLEWMQATNLILAIRSMNIDSKDGVEFLVDIRDAAETMISPAAFHELQNIANAGILELGFQQIKVK
jgi:hypothetical protein